MRIQVLTLFPGMFRGALDGSILKRAQDKGFASIDVKDLRDFTEDRHRQVDDYPFGGGGGMILKPEPIFRAVEALRGGTGRVILLDPQGRTFTQGIAAELAKAEHLIFLCGRYEGIDERVRFIVDDEISIGDYVLTGGELPALVVIDAVVRLLPGLLGDAGAPGRDSFATGLLEGPQYTRPASFRGLDVPAVLLSGDHKAVAIWRRRQALWRTHCRRPELLRMVEVGREDREWLEEMIRAGGPST